MQQKGPQSDSKPMESGGFSGTGAGNTPSGKIVGPSRNMCIGGKMQKKPGAPFA